MLGVLFRCWDLFVFVVVVVVVVVEWLEACCCPSPGLDVCFVGLS